MPEMDQGLQALLQSLGSMQLSMQQMVNTIATQSQQQSMLFSRMMNQSQYANPVLSQAASLQQNYIQPAAGSFLPPGSFFNNSAPMSTMGSYNTGFTGAFYGGAQAAVMQAAQPMIAGSNAFSTTLNAFSYDPRTHSDIQNRGVAAQAGTDIAKFAGSALSHTLAAPISIAGMAAAPFLPFPLNLAVGIGSSMVAGFGASKVSEYIGKDLDYYTQYKEDIRNMSPGFVRWGASNNKGFGGGFTETESEELAKKLHNMNQVLKIPEKEFNELRQTIMNNNLLGKVDGVEEFGDKMAKTITFITSAAKMLNTTKDHIAEMMAEYKKLGLNYSNIDKLTAELKLLTGITGNVDASSLFDTIKATVQGMTSGTNANPNNAEQGAKQNITLGSYVYEAVSSMHTPENDIVSNSFKNLKTQYGVNSEGEAGNLAYTKISKGLLNDSQIQAMTGALINYNQTTGQFELDKAAVKKYASGNYSATDMYDDAQRKYTRWGSMTADLWFKQSDSFFSGLDESSRHDVLKDVKDTYWKTYGSQFKTPEQMWTSIFPNLMSVPESSVFDAMVDYWKDMKPEVNNQMGTQAYIQRFLSLGSLQGGNNFFTTLKNAPFNIEDWFEKNVSNRVLGWSDSISHYFESRFDDITNTNKDLINFTPSRYDYDFSEEGMNKFYAEKDMDTYSNLVKLKSLGFDVDVPISPTSGRYTGKGVMPSVATHSTYETRVEETIPGAPDGSDLPKDYRDFLNNITQYEPNINRYSTEYKVDPNVVRGLMMAESSGAHYNADGSVKRSKLKDGSPGAIGIMQLMPGTAAGLGVDPFDPDQNIKGGTKYIADKVADYHGNVALALAAYNGGSGKVSAAIADAGLQNVDYANIDFNKISPYLWTETQNYVTKVLKNIDTLNKSASGTLNKNLITTKTNITRYSNEDLINMYGDGTSSSLEEYGDFRDLAKNYADMNYKFFETTTSADDINRTDLQDDLTKLNQTRKDLIKNNQQDFKKQIDSITDYLVRLKGTGSIDQIDQGELNSIIEMINNLPKELQSKYSDVLNKVKQDLEHNKTKVEKQIDVSFNDNARNEFGSGVEKLDAALGRWAESGSSGKAGEAADKLNAEESYFNELMTKDITQVNLQDVLEHKANIVKARDSIINEGGAQETVDNINKVLDLINKNLNKIVTGQEVSATNSAPDSATTDAANKDITAGINDINNKGGDTAKGFAGRVKSLDWSKASWKDINDLIADGNGLNLSDPGMAQLLKGLETYSIGKRREDNAAVDKALTDNAKQSKDQNELIKAAYKDIDLTSPSYASPQEYASALRRRNILWAAQNSPETLTEEDKQYLLDNYNDSSDGGIGRNSITKEQYEVIKKSMDLDNERKGKQNQKKELTTGKDSVGTRESYEEALKKSESKYNAFGDATFNQMLEFITAGGTLDQQEYRDLMLRSRQTGATSHLVTTQADILLKAYERGSTNVANPALENTMMSAVNQVIGLTNGGSMYTPEEIRTMFAQKGLSGKDIDTAVGLYNNRVQTPRKGTDVPLYTQDEIHTSINSQNVKTATDEAKKQDEDARKNTKADADSAADIFVGGLESAKGAKEFFEKYDTNTAALRTSVTASKKSIQIKMANDKTIDEKTQDAVLAALDSGDVDAAKAATSGLGDDHWLKQLVNGKLEEIGGQGGHGSVYVGKVFDQAYKLQAADAAANRIYQNTIAKSEMFTSFAKYSTEGLNFMGGMLADTFKLSQGDLEKFFSQDKADNKNYAEKASYTGAITIGFLNQATKGIAEIAKGDGTYEEKTSKARETVEGMLNNPNVDKRALASGIKDLEKNMQEAFKESGVEFKQVVKDGNIDIKALVDDLVQMAQLSEKGTKTTSEMLDKNLTEHQKELNKFLDTVRDEVGSIKGSWQQMKVDMGQKQTWHGASVD